MKRAWMAVLLVAVVAGLGFAASMPAADPLNDKCPVGNKDIDAKCTVELKVALCCKDCKEKWDKDPASFLAKIDKLPNAKCPVSGEDAGKDCAGTATVAFCCGNCKGKFEKDSAPYLSKIKAAAKK
jgi:YHS domain-containing protein